MNRDDRIVLAVCIVILLSVGLCILHLYTQSRRCAKAGGYYTGETCFDAASLKILPFR